MNTKVYGHRSGDKLIPADLIAEAVAAVDACSIVPKRKASKAIKDAILESLVAAGWPGKVAMDPASKITITSLKNKVGLCFQTGNMGRMYADLIKLQAIYLRGSIDAGIYILPEPACAKILGENIADCGRLMRELPIFDRVITIPLAIIGIE